MQDILPSTVRYKLWNQNSRCIVLFCSILTYKIHIADDRIFDRTIRRMDYGETNIWKMLLNSASISFPSPHLHPRKRASLQHNHRLNAHNSTHRYLLESHFRLIQVLYSHRNHVISHPFLNEVAQLLFIMIVDLIENENDDRHNDKERPDIAQTINKQNCNDGV